MSEDKTYNGWTNYETWCVALWLGNDGGGSDYWRTRAQEVYDEAEPGEYAWQDRESEATGTLADEIESQHEEYSPAGISGVYADLLTAAAGKVDWRDIARHYIDDVDKADTAEAEAK